MIGKLPIPFRQFPHFHIRLAMRGQLGHEG
jgi:hypothetical protein